LDFLGPSLFQYETPDYERWIVLDFLGFARQNRYFSMDYTEFSPKKNSRPLFRCASSTILTCGNAPDWFVKHISVISVFLQDAVPKPLLFGGLNWASRAIGIGHARAKSALMYTKQSFVAAWTPPVKELRPP
jgi:hypothetical protein